VIIGIRGMEPKELQAKKKQALKYLEKYNTLKKEVEDSCHHPEEHLVAKSNYYGGDYLNTSYTEYWTQCTICLKCSEITTESHGSYA
jgi:hypothetical protein